MVVMRESGRSAEDMGEKNRGVVFNPGPYKSYEDAYYAVLSLAGSYEDDRD